MRPRFLERGPLSEPITKDQVLANIFAASGLLCFVLSFTLFAPTGRPILFGATFLCCLVCLALSDNKSTLLLSFVVITVTRLLWVLVATG